MRPKLPKDIKNAITLREAGYTLASIVEQTGISASTLQRAFKKHGVGRGSLSTESIEQARQQLLSDATFIESLKVAIASSIKDDLSLARQIRESLTLTLEEITKDTGTHSSLKARSLAALSTSASITQTIMRKALQMDSGELTQIEELPTLTITRMTEEQIQAAKDSFKSEGDESVTADLTLTTD